MKKVIKKIVSSILMLSLMLSLFGGTIGVLGVQAAPAEENNKILMGVPVLDGQVDEIYKQSLTLSTGVGENAYGTTWDDNNGNIYFLYSENYLYICADIKDDSVVSRGEVYVEGNNPYQNDNCEFRLSLDGGTTTIKVGIDAYGLRCYGLDADMAKTDYSKIRYMTTYDDASKDSGYVIEVAIPCTEGILDMHTAGKLGFKLQLNDLDYDGAYYYFATNYAGEGPKGLVYYDLSTEIAEGSVAGGDAVPDDDFDDVEEVADYKKLSFNIQDSNSAFYDGSNSGTHVLDEQLGVRHISSGETGRSDSKYKMSPQFVSADDYDSEYKYIRVLYAAQNPEGVDKVTMLLVGDGTPDWKYIDREVVDTNGEFVLSDCVELTEAMTARYMRPAHMSLYFLTSEEGGAYYIDSFYFFKTEEDARNFEVPKPKEIEYKKLSFNIMDGNSTIVDRSDSGSNQVLDEDLGVRLISYSDSEWLWSHYRLCAQFTSKSDYDAEYKYVRVLYAAENPEGTASVKMKLVNDGAADNFVTWENVVSTNGKFILSECRELNESVTGRYAAGHQCSLLFPNVPAGGKYYIDSIYFFKTAQEAEKFDPTSSVKQIQINGNDISNYKIVIPKKNTLGNELDNAKMLRLQIKALSGVMLPIVYDEESQDNQYEILIGYTNREASRSYYEEGGKFHPNWQKFSSAQYRIDRVDDKIVMIASNSRGIEDVIELFGKKLRSSESLINITATEVGIGMNIWEIAQWGEVTNVAEPVQFTDGFDVDEGYWTTDSDKQGWQIETESGNNVFSAGATGSVLSYLHVFEKNVSFEARLKATASQTGQVSLLLRHTADYAYVKVGYDYATGEWFVDSREGEDFLNYRYASHKATLTDGEWYNVKAVVDGDAAELYVNGEKILTADNLVQLTPGKIGIMSEGVAAKLDDVSISLLSGLGTIVKNIVHTKLPDELFREGGTVWEMKDKSLIYSDWRTQASFISRNNGKTWERTDPWGELEHYPNVLRLQNENFLKVNTEIVNGTYMKTSQISSDEGATWSTVGTMYPYLYYYQDAYAGYASNMNDKLTQMSDGRIFYPQSYDGNGVNQGYLKTFVEVWYSDDNGVTWNKSETDSWEIEGNESEEYFAECKILETAEGKLRMYCSWNAYGCIVYSESEDNGVTWGPIQKMEDFKCSNSSMQFVRDPYADNDTTYYMVWVRDCYATELSTRMDGHPRACLSLAKSTDGINWVYLCDLWRWESNYIVDSMAIQHLVDPFLKVTEDYVIAGSGLSEKMGGTHHAQRQHIWSVAKDTLEEETIEVEIKNIGAVNSDVTIIAPEDGWIEGTNSFTVAAKSACVILVSNDGGVTYERLAATKVEGNAENCYSFTAENVTADTQITVALAGDVNGDGELNIEDSFQVKAAALGRVTPEGIAAFTADVNGDGKYNIIDSFKVKAAVLGDGEISW